jgi:hypothetical protein
LASLFSKEGFAVERQDGKASDHGIFFVAGIFVLGLLAFVASRSPVVLHRIELPLLRIQAKIYSCFPIGEDHGTELLRIENILAIVDAEVARTGNYGRINTKALGKAMTAASRSTKSTTRILSCTLVCVLGSLVAIRTVRVRRRLHDNRENVLVGRRQGVEGFLQVTGRYLEPDTAVHLSREPTPERLADAFSAVRAKVNIPCSVVARLFERGSRERMALLGYGKVSVTFADEKMDAGICRNKSGKEI